MTRLSLLTRDVFSLQQGVWLGWA